MFRSPYPDLDILNVPFTDFVLEGAGELADRPALIDGVTGGTISYGQLEASARAVAAGLARRGFAKGDVVAHYAPNLPDYAVAFHGVALAGGSTPL